MDRFFKLKENGTNVRTEIVAGLTTFMTMAYILFVNTLFLGSAGAGMSDNAVFFATAVGAGLMTIIMGLFVNVPIALAPGMGLNAYFMTVVLSSNGAISWQAKTRCCIPFRYRVHYFDRDSGSANLCSLRFHSPLKWQLP